MTDTAGYSDVVFGLFWLLGYQLSPRLRDISDMRYWRLDRSTDYGRLDGVARHRIRPERIERHWEDLLRIAGSLKLGTVRASDLMRTLQSGGRVSRLRQAIAELGRMVKTLYLLAYISDADYRRPILVQLNRGESRHTLARAVFFGRRGQLRQAYRQGQEDRLGAGVGGQRHRVVEHRLHGRDPGGAGQTGGAAESGRRGSPVTHAARPHQPSRSLQFRAAGARRRRRAPRHSLGRWPCAARGAAVIFVQLLPGPLEYAATSPDAT